MQPSDHKKPESWENGILRPSRIVVSVAEQSLTLVVESGEILCRFDISTSRYGVGFREGSLQTPVGRFRIAEKIGHDEREGMIFKARKPTGEIGTDENPADLVLTRILWLDGLDPENANTHARYIYIHGTNHEGTIGKPASIGCVRMRNAEIIELFDRVETGLSVWIV